jgi:hypothetical protein
MNRSDQKRIIKLAINEIMSKAFRDGSYVTEMRISYNGNAAAGEMRRGDIMNLLCFGACSLCFCPYNLWGLRLYFNGNILKFELSRRTSQW